MATIDLGLGLKILVITLSACLLMGIGAMFGITWLKNEQNESNTEVISIDSREGVKITKETKEKKVIINEKVNSIKKPIVDNAGYLDDSFMLLMESARSDAIERGNEGGIINSLTHP